MVTPAPLPSFRRKPIHLLTGKHQLYTPRCLSYGHLCQDQAEQGLDHRSIEAGIQERCRPEDQIWHQSSIGSGKLVKPSLHGVSLSHFKEVTGVNLQKKIVILEGGKDTLPYDKLILASGGTPRRLPIEGANLENVFTFRGIADAQKVDAGMVQREFGYENQC